MVTEFDVEMTDGRIVHVYDTGGADRFPVLWHHGSPNIGAPPAPLFPLAEQLGLRFIGHDRPSYGGSTPRPGRSVASVADDVAAITDRLGIEAFATMGHSGGGPRALACAALLPDRVLAAVSIAGLAPFGGDGFDFFAGMAESGTRALGAALDGRAARAAFEESATDDLDIGFTPEDERALGARWAWFLDVVRPAVAAGPEGMIDDDLAAMAPPGFDLAEIQPPVLLVHGERDRVVPVSHARWLAQQCPTAALRVIADAGHITVMDHAADALTWLRHRIDEYRAAGSTD